MFITSQKFYYDTLEKFRQLKGIVGKIDNSLCNLDELRVSFGPFKQF